MFLLLGLSLVAALAAVAEARPARPDLIQQAFSQLYNFDFAGAQRTLDQRLAEDPSDPLGYVTSAAAHLFSELHRLRILDSQFLVNDRRITEKTKVGPDAEVKRQLFQAIDQSRRHAQARLARDPEDGRALFSLALASGILSDYVALIEKMQFASLGHARVSQGYAVRLLEVDPQFWDAYLTTGISEYLVGSLPFFIRWFVGFQAVRGSKQQAIENLERAAREGKYLGPFARILLSIIYLRENKPGESERLLAQLAADYPANPLFRAELTRLSARLRRP